MSCGSVSENITSLFSTAIVLIKKLKYFRVQIPYCYIPQCSKLNSQRFTHKTRFNKKRAVLTPP